MSAFQTTSYSERANASYLPDSCRGAGEKAKTQKQETTAASGRFRRDNKISLLKRSNIRGFMGVMTHDQQQQHRLSTNTQQNALSSLASASTATGVYCLSSLMIATIAVFAIKASAGRLLFSLF